MRRYYYYTMRDGSMHARTKSKKEALYVFSQCAGRVVQWTEARKDSATAIGKRLSQRA